MVTTPMIGAQGAEPPLRTLLSVALEETGLSLGEPEQELLVRHLELVIERNKQLNLTRITSPRDAVYLHIIDSLLLCNSFSKAPRGSFVDIGTGAGYPGIPLVVATRRHATLVDSVGKKALAVQDFVEELGLEREVSVLSERIEVVAKTKRHSFALAVARAVARSNVLVEYATPLLKMGGRLVLAKAHLSEDEISTADRAARVCGMRRVSRETYELPHDLGHREIVSYERVKSSSIRLPRPVGTAQHHPLGLPSE